MKLNLYEARYRTLDSQNFEFEGRALIASNLNKGNTLAKFVREIEDEKDVRLVNVGSIILDLRKTEGNWGDRKTDKMYLYLKR